MKALAILILIGSLTIDLHAQVEKIRPEELLKIFERRAIGAITPGVSVPLQAVGISDKGRMLNVVSNFGVLSNFHLFNPAIQWPGTANDLQQYSFGVDLMVGLRGDAIESMFDRAIGVREFDWTPSPTKLFSGEVTASDGTPILATSDDVRTWPKNDKGERFWPGPFRVDFTTGKQVAGEFVSERDIYAVYNDAGNRNGPYGIEVEQMVYSFNRPMARDFLIYDFKIKNKGNQTLDTLYIGFFVDLKPDYDNNDILKQYEYGGGQMIYEYDANNTPRSPWDMVGHIGVAALPSPLGKRFTDFHYFDDDYSPQDDRVLWNIMTSRPENFSPTERAKFFHGSNPRWDDVSLSAALDPKGNNQGTDVTYILSSGPHRLERGDSLRFTFAIIAGEDEATIKRNFEFAVEMAKKEFLSSGPPSTPTLWGHAGDRRVTLVWDNSTEYSVDALTGKRDFQGYKLYRSVDRGITWGKPVTDSRGVVVDYVPLAQFDLVDNVSGTDPHSGLFLGSNTGLKNFYVDTTVINGLEYWYSIVAYDNGFENIPQGVLNSPRGLVPEREKQIVRVTPGKPASDLFVGMTDSLDVLKPTEGITDGIVRLQVIEPSSLKGLGYTLSFNENDSVMVGRVTVRRNVTTYTLVSSKGDTLLARHPTVKSEYDFVPVTDGFRMIAIDSRPGRKFAGWTKVLRDTCTFDWYFKQKIMAPGTRDAQVIGIADFRMTIDRVSGDSIMVDDQNGGLHGPIWVPLKVHDITNPNNPRDVTRHTRLIDYEYAGRWAPNTFFGPKGWDLIPGGKGYNPFPSFGDMFPDELWFRSFPSENPLLPGPAVAEMKTQNQPDGIPPSDGDQYTILTYKPFSTKVKYVFRTPAPEFLSAEKQQVDLSRIRVVPNPLIVSTGFGSDGKQIMFNNLPKECTITILTTAGEVVARLEHTSSTGFKYWDVKNTAGRDIAYGLYVYVVETPSGQKQIGKFYIIR